MSTNSLPRAVRYGVAALCLSAAFGLQAANPVTFQVDMSVQLSSGNFVPGDTVEVRGNYMGWGPGLALTNDPTCVTCSNIYSITTNFTDAVGTLESYKFWNGHTGAPNGGWESPASTCGNNRTITLANGGQVLPLVYFDDSPPVLPNNNVTFQVDMTAQVITGAFTNGTSQVTVSGGFNGWGGGDVLTNNPALSGNASNIYSGISVVQAVPGACQSYKFRANGGWENPASTGGGNRTFNVGGGNQVLPLVFYNDASLCDLVQVPTSVKFVLQITNGTVATDGTIFNSSANKLYVNGDFLGWWTWNTGFGGSEGPQYELTNNPVGSDTYEHTFLVSAGNNLSLTYKYSIDGFDNEAGFAVNHLRYIRSPVGVPYTFPTDRFGTNPAPPLVEQSFGNLVTGPASGGTIPITWSGRQCVVLQVRTNLNSGVWVDVPGTDASSATNWPNTGGTRYFRLKKN